MKTRLFISHASEDKRDFVRPLAEALRQEFDVWYDEYELVIGMSLLQEISKGLANCDHGVVVFSHAFFAKKWPLSELNGLFALEEKDKKVILPIWHGIGADDMKSYSPMFVDRVAGRSGDGIAAVVRAIRQSVAYFERGKSVQSVHEGRQRLRDTLLKKAEVERSDRLVSAEGSAPMAAELGGVTLDRFCAQVVSLRNEGLAGIRHDGPEGNNAYRKLVVRCGTMNLLAQFANDVINNARSARLHVALYRQRQVRWGEQPSIHKIDEHEYAVFVDSSDQKLWQSVQSKQRYSVEEFVDYWLGKLSVTLEAE